MNINTRIIQCYCQRSSCVVKFTASKFEIKPCFDKYKVGDKPQRSFPRPLPIPVSDPNRSNPIVSDLPDYLAATGFFSKTVHLNDFGENLIRFYGF